MSLEELIKKRMFRQSLADFCFLSPLTPLVVSYLNLVGHSLKAFIVMF